MITFFIPLEAKTTAQVRLLPTFCYECLQA